MRKHNVDDADDDADAVFEYVSFEIVPLQFAWHFC